MMGLLAAGKVPGSRRLSRIHHEGSAIVTSLLYGQLIARGCSAVSRVRAAAPSATTEAAKRMHPLFGMTRINADVWPLSPQDWSTG
jgi:hypothetical protein